MPDRSRASGVWVDRRWSGTHGIGRYSDEVVTRLQVGAPIGQPRRAPTTLRGMVLGQAWRLPRGGLFYSPGFAPVTTAARQLLTLHDLIHLDAPRGWRRGFYEHVVRPVIVRCGHVITVSEASRSALAEWLQGEHVRIHVTGNGCSDEFIAAGPVESRFGEYLLLVGNLRPHKNVRVVIEAMRQHRGAMRLVLVLPQEDAQALSRTFIAADRRIVVLTGLRDEELAALYRGARALLFPSLREGFGLPVLEAQRCGCPVVYARECASVREICGGAGLELAEGSNPDAWLEAIERLDQGLTPTVAGTDGYEWSGVAQRVALAVEAAGEDVPQRGGS